ncbi:MULTISPECIES: type II 3-dehydroquinate dehydratase [Thalassospira]|uniref:3-dehydroquinate dehydratase n=1 Tax=Thalassospira profundimaris TaxID=502049 RepID=A0A367VFF3_9PROT|nr:MULTISPECIES: type II 3-dehydroquinate dehydratase [Thalassospira]KZB73638.1 3-dehydroquinate dehydratase [Thalassospira sp. MCCC 1A01148]MBR9898474.1 type II 3-dehydroquinate dehydratase [Rhodospirillales bacterium]RCK23905.1 3-dehydroquinate dehydratase [Thalassospira profundimaris]
MSVQEILVINGPNLNLLGQRQPEIYGYDTLASIEEKCSALATELGVSVRFGQSNHEGAIIDMIHEARTKSAALIINAGAYTHTSIAIHDALKTFEGYIIELHISNPHAREEFRHTSWISPVADAVMAGAGAYGYELATRLAAEKIAAA